MILRAKTLASFWTATASSGNKVNRIPRICGVSGVAAKEDVMKAIRIENENAKYLWDVLDIKSNFRDDNTDEQFDGDYFYSLYDYNGLIIRADFLILDPNAEMDSNEFANFDKPDALYVVCPE